MKTIALFLGLLLSPAMPQQGAPTSRPTYDPLEVGSDDSVERIDMVAHAENREVPVLVFLPKAQTRPLPVILFSHGLGGNRTGCIYLGEHWAARGYAVAFMQHPGSDEDVWKGIPKWKRLGAMKRAASAENSELRTQDVSTTLDALAKWNEDEAHALYSRLNLEHIGMSGHSFGAVTTQMVSGQKSGLFGAKWIEQRVDASIAFSPSPPKFGSAKKAFANVFVPMLLMTGTKDESIIGGNDMESRTEVFPALPKANDRYELVLDGAEHSAFTDKKLVGEKDEHNPNHHRVILALSTAFWDANLRGDQQAQAWLDGEGPRSVMHEADKWRLAKAD